MDTYEKRYKDALEIAKKWRNAPNFDKIPIYANRVIEEIFPELAESEDERMLRNFKSYLQKEIESYTYDCRDEEDRQKLKMFKYILAWFEKQDEKKPQDKSSLKSINEKQVDFFKFHKGDWIVTNDRKDIFFIKDVSCGYCSLEDTKGKVYSNCQPLDSDFHLWTIEDAKDGDVLISQYDKPFIYNGNYDSSHIGSYCGILVEGGFKVSTEKCYWTENTNIHPATNKQRDLLFQNMKESGYDWDINKKELKKIKKNSTNSYCKEHCKGFQETGKCLADGECKAKRNAEQNPSWNDEDEQHCRYIIDSYLQEHYGATAITIEWLENLKYRVGSQQKQEWSEEDENRFNNLIRLVKKSNEGNATKQGFITFINKFKSIKPHWKPSEEQIEAFEYFVKSIGESGYASPYDNNIKLIYSLLNDLKKL